LHQYQLQSVFLERVVQALTKVADDNDSGDFESQHIFTIIESNALATRVIFFISISGHLTSFGSCFASSRFVRFAGIDRSWEPSAQPIYNL
jgi:hypothetical protein